MEYLFDNNTKKKKRIFDTGNNMDASQMHCAELDRKCESLSRVQLFATPWTSACQAPLSIEFSGQEYWKG